MKTSNNNSMKTYRVASPAYRGNGLNGTYYSIVVCDSSNSVLKVVGDHSSLIKEKTNIHDYHGESFSDEDRFVVITEVKVNLDLLSQIEEEAIACAVASNNWWKKREEIFGDLYEFIYGKKAKKGNKEVYEQWLLENIPPSSISEYEFLKAIEERNEVKLTRVYHQKGDGRVCSFLTNLTLEDVVSKNPILQEPERKILETREEYHYIGDNPNVDEYFENGILRADCTKSKPDSYNDKRGWDELYQRTTGMPLPKGGVTDEN